MREILFRGIDDDGELVYGSYMYPNVIATPVEIEGDIHYSYHIVNPETVGQLNNSLTKKAGVKVFEGDIITHNLEEGLGEPKSYGHQTTITHNEAMWNYYSDIKVIGNIHQNPELTSNTNT